MKSTQSFSWIKVVALAFLATCGGTSLASALEFNGQFTLPFEARWGATVLPAGEYTFTFENNRGSDAVVIVRSETQQALVPVRWIEDRDMSSHSVLITTHSGGEYRVRGLYLAELGVFLDYGLTPEGEREVKSGEGRSKMARTPGLIEELPVVAGK